MSKGLALADLNRLNKPDGFRPTTTARIRNPNLR